MLLFSRDKSVDVQTFLLRLVNNHCPDLGPLFENRREETRAPVCIVTLVVPLEKGHLQVDDLFPTVTKEFSTSGVSIVLDQPRGLDEVVLAFRPEQEMAFVAGKAKHLNPMGAGFYHLGIQLKRMVRLDEYPGLENLYL